MGFILFCTFIFLIWVGYKLVCLLSEEVYRQRNPHHEFSRESIAKQREETRRYYRSLYNQPNYQQFEKPRVPKPQVSKQSQIVRSTPSSPATTDKKEPQITVHYKTQERLYTLVRGDMKAARRLIDGVRERNPKRSNQWVWEKVIYDLERDKRMF